MTIEIFLLRVLSLLFGLGMFAQAYALRRKDGSWIMPATIFAIYWGAMTVVPVILVQDAAPTAGAFVAFLMVSMFSIGTVMVPIGNVNPTPQRVGLYDTRFLYAMLAGTAVLALGCLLINSSMQGIDLDRLFTLEAAAEYTESRYGGDLVANIFIQIATTLSYVAATICGSLIGNSGRKRPFLIFLGLSPTLFVLVTQSAKGSLLLSGALIAAGHFARSIDARESHLMSKKSLRILLFYLIAIFPLLMISFLARGAFEDVSSSEVAFQMYRYLLSYTSGHIFAFDDWMNFYWGNGSSIVYTSLEVSPGFYTLMSIFRAFGDQTFVPLGTYDEYYSLNDVLQTNVYTMYRGLITDFTFGGAMLFMMLSGVLAQMSYRMMLKAGPNIIATVCFVVFVGATQQSAYISLFQYNSAYVFGAILALILSANYAFWVKGSRERIERH